MRKPGNPNIAEAGKATQFPPVKPGESSIYLGVRIPESLAQRLEALGGSKSEHVRAALEQYFQQTEPPNKEAPL
jgi:hypothetical protein